MTDSNRTEPEGFEPFELQPRRPAQTLSKNDPTQQPGWERATLEKLAFAALHEQRAARRWRPSCAWPGWLSSSSWSGWPCSRGTPTTAKTTAAHGGGRDQGRDRRRRRCQRRFVVAAMKSAFEDEGAKGVVLLINSPGGSPVQAGIINDEIKRLRAKYNKPVYAVVEETCASAAYYIAAATDKIFVDKASIVGSIGVLMDGFGFTGLMDKLGVERRLCHGGREQGLSRPVQPDERRAARACAEDARPDPRAVHRRGQDGPRQAAEGIRPACSAACSGAASRRWNSAWPTSSATSTSWRAK